MKGKGERQRTKDERLRTKRYGLLLDTRFRRNDVLKHSTRSIAIQDDRDAN